MTGDGGAQTELAHGQRRKHAKKYAGQKGDEQGECQHTAIKGYLGHREIMLREKLEQPT